MELSQTSSHANKCFDNVHWGCLLVGPKFDQSSGRGSKGVANPVVCAQFPSEWLNQLWVRDGPRERIWKMFKTFYQEHHHEMKRNKSQAGFENAETHRGFKTRNLFGS